LLYSLNKNNSILRNSSPKYLYKCIFLRGKPLPPQRFCRINLQTSINGVHFWGKYWKKDVEGMGGPQSLQKAYLDFGKNL